MRTVICGSLWMSCLLPAAALADNGTILNLSASAQRELANDELTASLYVQDRHAQPAVLADRLNKALARARAEASGFKQVEFSSGSYNSWPDYGRDGKIQ